MKYLEETFGYDSQNRLTGIWLNLTQTGASAYDSYGRMTTKTANGQAVFSNVSFSSEKPHALTSATTAEGVFPSAAQTVAYTGFDKVNKVKQGTDSLCYSYGYDRQRILMEEHVGNTLRTKRYVGNCEYLTETTSGNTDTYWLTYLTGPYGVFAVVMSKSGNDDTFYALKDNLGSWTTITDKEGAVEQQLSYDAWGNLRNPQTWANYTQNDVFDKPMFDRGYTGHEHLTAFGLINMNGRVYDPVMSSFLSADRYVQDPSSAQGFNRYAYCLYNPLRYVDPTGWRSGGGGGHGSSGPINRIIINGHIYNILPEVTVTDNPSLSNTYEYEEYEYTPNITSGGFDNGWGNSNGWSSGRHSGGSGGGCGNHGGNYNNTTQSQNVNLETSSNIDLTPVNVSCFYLNSGNTLIGKGAEWASVISAGSKEASVFEKIATHSKYLGIIGVGINIGCTTYQMYYGEMPKHEGVVRMGMTGVEFGLTFVPYVGPLLSIGLTAYDIGGGFDDNLYKTENWWKEKQP